VLRTVRRFLEANPSETITLIFEPYTSDARIWEVFRSAGLDGYVYERTANESQWPTLRALGQRVIAFSTNAKDPSTKIMNYWTYAWENPYSYALPGDRDGESACRVDRGTASGPTPSCARAG
jgi:hypothetical protein